MSAAMHLIVLPDCTEQDDSETGLSIPQRLPDSLCTQSICCLPVAQGNIQQVSYRIWFNIRPTVVYPGTMYSALFLFALSYGATAPPTTDQTTLLLLDSENAAASFTPPYMFGSTAVFPAMFQLVLIELFHANEFELVGAQMLELLWKVTYY